MADFSPINLANGQLTTSDTVLYTVPGGNTVLFRHIVLVNVSNSIVTLNLWANFGSSNRCLVPYNLTLGAGQAVHYDITIALTASHAIRGQSNTNTAIDFVLSGVIA